MRQASFCIITPSYKPDFERCKLLSQTIEHFVSPLITHYIIVDRKDLALFRQLQRPHVEVLTVESVLPQWILKLPFIKQGWVKLPFADKNRVSWRIIPFRNWLLQQIVKLEVSQQIQKDTLLFVDSDVAFIKPFDLKTFVKGNNVRLFRVPYNSPEFDKWHTTAGELLGIPCTYQRNSYVGNLISWRRENALKLCQHLEHVSGKSWIEAVCGSWYFSEYTLYGVFVDQVLKEQSKHFADSTNLCLEYWSSDSMSDESLNAFMASTKPEQVAVMLSSKAGISVDRYRPLIKRLN